MKQSLTSKILERFSEKTPQIYTIEAILNSYNVKFWIEIKT